MAKAENNIHRLEHWHEHRDRWPSVKDNAVAEGYALSDDEIASASRQPEPEIAMVTAVESKTPPLHRPVHHLEHWHKARAEISRTH
jgi:hypothetical protein